MAIKAAAICLTFSPANVSLGGVRGMERGRGGEGRAGGGVCMNEEGGEDCVWGEGG